MPSTWKVIRPPAEIRRSGTRQELAEVLEQIRQIQLLRGRVYLGDGALSASDLDSEGRHCSPYDQIGWHAGLFSEEGAAVGCMRLTTTAICSQTERIQLFQIDDALDRQQSEDRIDRKLDLHRTLANLALAGRISERITVTGGWAVDKTVVSSAEAVQLVLAAHWISWRLGINRSMYLATERNNSHKMLTLLGGKPQAPKGSAPMFFDPAYGCSVGILLGIPGEVPDRFRPTLAHVFGKLNALHDASPFQLT